MKALHQAAVPYATACLYVRNLLEMLAWQQQSYISTSALGVGQQAAVSWGNGVIKLRV